MVAGGSLRAIEAVLRGDVEHAFHPGGGLHHAMPDRASGFCIYDDPALAIARARRDGLRVLYVDLDVHHGDGVQAIHWDDPGVLTLSFHETGRYLFPGTGGVDELGEGTAAGTSVNVPLEPETGEGAWLAAVQVLLPELAAAFGPDLIVSQHGADSHAWDPLAHLRVTTTAMGEAARLVDRGGAPARAAVAGWRPVAAATTRTGSCHGAGASSGWPGRIARSRTRRPTAWRERWAAEARALRPGAAPRDVRGCPERGRRDGRVAGHGRGPRRSRRSGSSGGSSCRGSSEVARDRGWWDPLASVRTPGRGRRRADATATGGPEIIRCPTPRRGSDSAWRRVSWPRPTRLPGTP